MPIGITTTAILTHTEPKLGRPNLGATLLADLDTNLALALRRCVRSKRPRHKCKHNTANAIRGFVEAEKNGSRRMSRVCG